MQRIRPITCAQTALFTEKSSNDAISDPLHIPLPGIGIPTKKKQPSEEPKAQLQVRELSINGGVFVTTGLSMKDEAWVKEQVEAKGGAFKGGFVKSITCLVINPDYERETTKLTKTKALIAEGKDIKIVTLSEFKELVE